jgi:hypothetical protein
MKEKCSCGSCGKEYVNTPDNYSWYLCHECMDNWWAQGCPIEE